ncbi:hypothetical protein XF_2016 [Xylella fastidiosa 9a5c]|uniref:Uncharacterized protein n=1 Tax=Xylella fastidiosa (strain 9a5c) TaxID=160492 RepID=Q9PBW9_XYLFA|nr:hypothetical protein XF_2016 [Xylella fastidiosa 9a5c]
MLSQDLIHQSTPETDSYPEIHSQSLQPAINTPPLHRIQAYGMPTTLTAPEIEHCLHIPLPPGKNEMREYCI